MKVISPDFIAATIAAVILTNCYHHRLPKQQPPKQPEMRADAQVVGLREETTEQLPPVRIERPDVIPMPYIHRLPTPQELSEILTLV